MRVEIDIDEDDRERVREVADARGLRMSRAYAELLRDALEDADEVD